MVTPEFLMEGAHYALEQCGRLLHNSITLYQNESYASATVLAALAREELGKAIELRSMRREALAGATFTAKDIKRRCGTNHIQKQERGQTSIVLRDVPLNELLGNLHDPQSDEYQRADARLQEIVAEQASRAPAERHQARMSSLYVDPDDTGTAWNRPQLQTQDDAHIFLTDAINDYSVQYDHYQRGNVAGDGKELYDALQKWGNRPYLPEPKWP